MALLSKKTLLERIRKSPESRKRLVESNLDKGVAYQIRNTRDARKMTQGQLASLTGMTQNNVSRLESPDYGRYTISSLKRIAEAFGVALVVRFVPFSQYIDWLSGTPHLDRGLSPSALAPPDFATEESSGTFDQAPLTYWPVIQGGKQPGWKTSSFEQPEDLHPSPAENMGVPEMKDRGTYAAH